MDLSTTYLGLKLKNPLVAAASPLSKNLDNYKILEDAGISAIVTHSLYEEQITHEVGELQQAVGPQRLQLMPRDIGHGRRGKIISAIDEWARS